MAFFSMIIYLVPVQGTEQHKEMYPNSGMTYLPCCKLMHQARED